MKTQPFEPPTMGGKDRVKIIVKPGHWTQRAREGKLFHLLTAHPMITSPNVKIEVRRAHTAPPHSPTHGPMSQNKESTTSSRSAAGEETRMDPAVLSANVMRGCAEPAATAVTETGAPANHAGHQPSSSFGDPVLDQACDPMMSGSVFCEEELTPGGATVYKELVAPGDEEDLTPRVGGEGEAGGGGGHFREEDLTSSSGGPRSSEASSVMDYEAFDMPIVGDLDLLESMLTSAACQSGREGEENSSGGSLVLSFVWP